MTQAIVPDLRMVTATYKGAALSVRFCKPDAVNKRLFDGMAKQVRNRFDDFKDLKPAEVKARLNWTVWGIPAEPTRGGYPMFLEGVRRGELPTT